MRILWMKIRTESEKINRNSIFYQSTESQLESTGVDWVETEKMQVDSSRLSHFDMSKHCAIWFGLTRFFQNFLTKCQEVLCTSVLIAHFHLPFYIFSPIILRWCRLSADNWIEYSKNIFFLQFFSLHFNDLYMSGLDLRWPIFNKILFFRTSMLHLFYLNFSLIWKPKL